MISREDWFLKIQISGQILYQIENRKTGGTTSHWTVPLKGECHMKSIFYHMALKLVWQFSAPPASFWCKTCLIINSFWSAPRAMLECATEHQHTAVFVVPRVPVEHWPCIDTNCMLLHTLRLPVILSQNVYFEEKMSLWGKHYSMYNVFWIFLFRHFFATGL